MGEDSMKPRVCYNCGAPWKPRCEYCGTEYECDPPHDHGYTSNLALQMQAMNQSQLANAQAAGLGAAFSSGLFGALTGIKF
jgi:hypothetical protein